MDFRFLIFGDSSKKRSDPGARPRPNIGVSFALFGVGFTEVLVDRELLRLMSFSCAFRSSEADIVGFLSSSGLSEKGKQIDICSIIKCAIVGNFETNNIITVTVPRLHVFLRLQSSLAYKFSCVCWT